MECGDSYASLPEAVKEGLIDEKQIDISLKRLMKARFELGEMDEPSQVSWAQIPYSVVDSKEHRELALRMARESLVLLLPMGDNYGWKGSVYIYYMVERRGKRQAVAPVSSCRGVECCDGGTGIPSGIGAPAMGRYMLMVMA